MYATTLADPVRLQQFTLLCGTPRPLQGPMVVYDKLGKAWACARINAYLFAVPVVRLQKGLSFGAIAERVLWLAYSETRSRRVPQLRFSTEELLTQIWGSLRTRRSAQTLRRTLQGLAELRIAEWPPDMESPPLEQSLPLFVQINADSDSFVFVVGDGLLGSLEQFATRSDDGLVAYAFPTGKRLKSLRRQQRVQDVYLPIYLGDLAVCKRFTSRQKRLFQAIVNEVTCPPKGKESTDTAKLSRSLEQALVIRGDTVTGYNGQGTTECPYLMPQMNYVGFNGNGVRRGHGYKLRTWISKAGYLHAERLRFLDDLVLLSDELGLVVAAIGKGHDNWCPLSHIVLLARANASQTCDLENLHIRVYAKADCAEHWGRLFKWNPPPDTAIQPSEQLAATDVVDRLRETLLASGLQQQQLATQLKVSKQYLNAVLCGKKRCSGDLKKRIEKHLAHTTKPSHDCDTEPVDKPQFELLEVHVKKGSSTLRKAAVDYYDRGLCVIPIRSWEVSRKPFVKWAQFQEERPTRQQVVEWWTQWPDAGIAVILGSVSNLLCADVDGEQAHRILLDLLGEIPLAPTVKSGGADPFRYHLYFRHPEQLATASSKTPFNDDDDKGKLELRGDKGLLVLPPSLHKSGRRYAWVARRSLDDVALPQLPDVLLEALETALTPLVSAKEPDVPSAVAVGSKTGGQTVDFSGYRVAPSTARFLSGRHAESNHWNQRLFCAGCDLNARGVPITKAEKLLLLGAKPKTAGDEQAARDTIASAYSQPRLPARY